MGSNKTTNKTLKHALQPNGKPKSKSRWGDERTLGAINEAMEPRRDSARTYNCSTKGCGNTVHVPKGEIRNGVKHFCGECA